MEAQTLIPLTLRLQSLEAQIKGVPSDAAGSASNGETAVPHIIKQMRVTQETLERVGQDSEALKRLLAGYEGYKHLLSLPGEEIPEETYDLPDEAKVALLVESRNEMIAAERGLREIELLKERGVEGSGNLESILELRPDVARQMELAETRRKELITARTGVVALLRRYTDFSATVSDMFLDLHHRLEALEEDVRRAERFKRKELKERF